MHTLSCLNSAGTHTQSHNTFVFEPHSLCDITSSLPHRPFDTVFLVTSSRTIVTVLICNTTCHWHSQPSSQLFWFVLHVIESEDGSQLEKLWEG